MLGKHEQGGGGNNLLFGKMFAENCMKVKEIGLALHLIRHS